MNEERYKRIVLTAAIVAVVSIGIVAAILGARGVFGTGAVGTVEVDEERSFPLSGVDALEAFSTSADIRFVKDGGDEIRYHLHGTARGNTKSIPTLAVESTGKRLSAGSKPPSRLIGSFSSNLILEVYLPDAYSGSISIRSVSGKIELPSGGYEDVAVETTSGGINLSGVGASEIEIETTSGAISAEGLVTSSFGVKSTSGGIRASGVLGRVNARSTSGSIDLTYRELSDDADIDETSGRVRIRLPDDASFELDVRTTSGGIECEFPITIDDASGRERNRLNGTVGSGGPEISIRTVSGGVEVLR
jgi:lia operon protein LiaG